MYALIIPTNQRNKESERQGPRKNQEIHQNKTKPGAKNHKTQKITKGGQPGCPVVGRLLCMTGPPGSPPFVIFCVL